MNYLPSTKPKEIKINFVYDQVLDVWVPEYKTHDYMVYWTQSEMKQLKELAIFLKEQE